MTQQDTMPAMQEMLPKENKTVMFRDLEGQICDVRTILNLIDDMRHFDGEISEAQDKSGTLLNMLLDMVDKLHSDYYSAWNNEITNNFKQDIVN